MTQLAPDGARRYGSVYLDAIRGVAAFAVVAFHIRYKFFLDYSQVSAPTLLVRVFYAMTSFGRDAVMVFFVLSGYLIAGTILKDPRRHDWSWSRYLLHRLVRLYVVLVPGLILTMFWDELGMNMFAAHPAYSGALQPWINDFFPVRERFTVPLFFENLGFLQETSGIPTFGTATPMWSLTYEFAYYLLFPAALLVFWPGRQWQTRVLCAAATVLLVYHFAGGILVRFPIWLFGVIVQIAPQGSFFRRLLPTTRNSLTAITLMVGIVVTHTATFRGWTGDSILASDYFVGVVFAAALWVFVNDGRLAKTSWYWWATGAAARISYTLYVVHMSLLIFLRAMLIPGRPWTPTAATVLASFVIGLVVVAYATAVWYVAESRTDVVRRFVAARALALRGRLVQDSQ